MFTDIVGSTSLLEAMGDEAWQSLLSWHDKTLRALFAANRGEEVTATGDGFFVAFESPDDALACAAVIQRGLADHRANAGFAPQVRIGLHALRRDDGRPQLHRQGRPRGREDRRPRGRRPDRRERADRRGRRLPGAGPAETRRSAGISDPIEVVTVNGTEPGSVVAPILRRIAEARSLRDRIGILRRWPSAISRSCGPG